MCFTVVVSCFCVWGGGARVWSISLVKYFVWENDNLVTFLFPENYFTKFMHQRKEKRYVIIPS